MKSRVLVAFGIALLLVLAASAAMAETGACPLHPNAEVVLVPTTEYACIDSGKHCAYSWNEMFCAECGNFLGEDQVHITVSDSEFHSFDSKAVCTQCGFNMSLNRQRSQLNGIATNDLQMMALAIGRSAIGGTLEVQNMSVNVRTDYDATSKAIASVPAGARIAILDYAEDNDGNVWYGVRVNRKNGWISANLVLVSPNPNPVIDKNTVTVKAEGNVRVGAGTSYDVVGYAHVNNVFKVLNTVTVADGGVWYMIQFGDTTAWISAAICR